MKLFPRLSFFLLTLLSLALTACHKDTPRDTAERSPLKGTYWTEGTGTMTLDFHSEREVTFTLTPAGSPRGAMAYTATYSLSGSTLTIGDIIQDTPFGTATILQGFTAQLEGGVIKADFRTTGMERDSDQGTLRFVAQPLKGYLFHHKV